MVYFPWVSLRGFIIATTGTRTFASFFAVACLYAHRMARGNSVLCLCGAGLSILPPEFERTVHHVLRVHCVYYALGVTRVPCVLCPRVSARGLHLEHGIFCPAGETSPSAHQAHDEKTRPSARRFPYFHRDKFDTTDQRLSAWNPLQQHPPVRGLL